MSKCVCFFKVLEVREGEEKGNGEVWLFVCYSYKIAGEAALLFLRAVHFKISWCIPETRLGYSENKVQKRGTERGPEGKQLCGRGGQEETAEKEKINGLSSSNCIRKAEEAVFIQKLRMYLV